MFLENLPGLETLSQNLEDDLKNNAGSNSIKYYINWIISTSVIFGSILAVVYIIFGGVIYMTKDSFTGKSEGKEYLTNAVMGLIFLITGYIIFTQLNPNILNINLSSAGRVNVEVDGLGFGITPSDLDSTDKCEYFDGEYEKVGLDGKFCSGGEELSGLWEGLEWIGNKFDTVEDFKNWIYGDEERITPKQECEMTRNVVSESEIGRVSPCYACDTSVAGITQKYCFKYNKTQIGQSKIDLWKRLKEKDGKVVKCGSSSGRDEDALKHYLLGDGKNILYNNGNGIEKRYFSTDGLNYSDNYKSGWTVCMAGLPLNSNEYAVLDGNTCSKSSYFDIGSCKKYFDDYKKYHGKGRMENCVFGRDTELVYARNEGTFYVAYQKSCER